MASPFTRTAGQMYGKTKSISSMAYNDQPQNGASVNDEIFAHAKGKPYYAFMVSALRMIGTTSHFY